ncbi:MAG: TPM domain-containing protein [Planctomycetes bacterium]|nr:TPM domain-containing protein [Planctomycetota bacterium]
MTLARVLLGAALGVLAAAGCSPPGDAYDTNTAVPAGDPPFTPLAASWVIDNAGVLRPDTVREAGALCQQLQDDGIAEVVVLVQTGVKHPSDYATHYGRWLKLGRRGLSTEGGNNGLVWLIRPDAGEKMTYSTGRGLPRLTSSHMLDIMNEAKDYFNFGNYDEGVKVLVRETDKALRALYGKKGEAP